MVTRLRHFVQLQGRQEDDQLGVALLNLNNLGVKTRGQEVA